MLVQPVRPAKAARRGAGKAAHLFDTVPVIPSIPPVASAKFAKFTTSDMLHIHSELSHTCNTVPVVAGADAVAQQQIDVVQQQ